MGDVSARLAFEALRSVAPGVERKLPSTTSKKSNASPVSDANKKIQIQGERLVPGEDPATATVIVVEFDEIRRTGDDLAKFLTLK
jgi:hypothetical protein